MAKGNISVWNSRVDHTVSRKGRNGVWYEYLIPKNGDDLLYYRDAIDVRSKKSASTEYKNGKRPGQYQPVGDKRYFNYYQLKKMGKTMIDGEAVVNAIKDLLF